ncbi:ANTH domain-containing protein [Geopyxis carbonaria]|nr:ANTH domain-containing protein [Geopyxis carbonaria]
MASSFEKSVKGATKHKCAAPKAKYVEHILIATHAGEAGIAEVFRALSIRLRESVWTTVFKALIVVHYMIREGEKDVTLRYLRRNPRMISLIHYSEGQIQGRNIRNYSEYLNERARTYGEVRTDYVRSGEGRLRKLSVEKGLLREVECIQVQIKALLACSFLDGDVDNEITLLAFRLLVSDLLVLFHAVNEGVINVLEHYFEMSRYDAERALEIYKVFTTQTADVVDYLQQARGVEPSTRLQIPNIKHAPTSLTSSLEEYLHDPDFDTNRRQYLAQQEAKRTGKPVAAVASTSKTAPAQNGPTPAVDAQPEPPKIAPDLIDFFESIETEQTPMFDPQPTQEQLFQQQQQQQAAMLYAQQTGFQPQIAAPQMMPVQNTGGAPLQQQQQAYQQTPTTNPFPVQPVQANYTGQGFGGYTPQPAPPMPQLPPQFSQQQQPPPQLQQPQQQLQQQQPQQQQQQFTMPPPQLQIPMPTGAATNPFRASMLSSTSPPPLQPQPTRSTNPFARPTTATSSTTSPTSPGSLTPNSALARSATTATGTNPFARTISPQPTGSLGVPGGTNPFRASMMLQQQQAQQSAVAAGNFSGQTGTLGGLENEATVPVFPRPVVAQQTGMAGGMGMQPTGMGMGANGMAMGVNGMNGMGAMGGVNGMGQVGGMNGMPQGQGQVQWGQQGGQPGM